MQINLEFLNYINRGRVGRGSKQSSCILMFKSNLSENAKKIKILKSSNDGFEISEEDMKLRVMIF